MTGTFAASYLPSIMIPLIAWLMPVVAMGLFFFYIEGEA